MNELKIKFIPIEEVPQKLGRIGKWFQIFSQIPEGKALLIENVDEAIKYSVRKLSN